MKAFVLIFAIIVYGVIYLPVYLPFLSSFVLRAADWRELRASLRLASLGSLLTVLFRPERPHSPRPQFGDDVAGSMAGSQYYLAHDYTPDLLWDFCWIWIIPALYAAAAVFIGFRLRASRQSRDANGNSYEMAQQGDSPNSRPAL